MKHAVSDLSNFIGTHVLSFQNPRVVCPPGTLTEQGRPNIIVATPRRSGTHVLIDLLLNNMPAYRTRPLYVDLDQCLKRTTSTDDLLTPITSRAGYIIKTHLPIGLDESVTTNGHVQRLIKDGIVLTVRRDRDAVIRSEMRWQDDQAETHADYEAAYDAFWRFWQDQDQIALDFKALFDPVRMGALMDDLAVRTRTATKVRFKPAPSPTGKTGIYANKALTRLLGRHAPLINTTIHTLKG